MVEDLTAALAAAAVEVVAAALAAAVAVADRFNAGFQESIFAATTANCPTATPPSLHGIWEGRYKEISEVENNC